MTKKMLVVSGIFLSLLLAASPVLAANTGKTATTTAAAKAAARAAEAAAKIACVGTAVATREAAIDAAVATHAQALSAAYSTRATELAGAYANTTAKTLRAGVKAAWADFNKSVRSAASAWKTARNTVWSTFRKAAVACKATSDVTDSGNSGSEVSGQ